MPGVASDYTELSLVEQPAIALFAQLGWTPLDCYHETFGPNGSLGRETPAEVVLIRRLRAALRRLNPGLPDEAIGAAIEELTRDRSAMGLAQANCEVYRLLVNGVRVPVRGSKGEPEIVAVVRAIDWSAPENNDFILTSQLWVTGDLYKRRADLVGFVNGLPLLFVELKASHRNVEDAYRDNLRDYKDTIPHVFWYNGFILLSNGSESRMGSLTATWEHFAEWKKIDREGERGVVSLETMIRGICERARFPDILENFTLFVV